MALEHALQHDAGERGLLALRMPDHLLDVITRPARGRDRIAAKTERMHADGKAGLFSRFVDRPIAALAEWLHIATQQQNLNEVLVPGAPADFGGGGRAILIGDHDRTFEAAVLAGPFRNLPVVDRAGQRRAQILIPNALPGIERT